MKIGSAVPTLTFAVQAGRNPSFCPLGPARVAFPTLLSHGEVIESVGGRVLVKDVAVMIFFIGVRVRAYGEGD